jgi:glutamine amidotransferase PdxT
MDRFENIRMVLSKFYPTVNFIVRESKTGKYNIIIRGVKSLTYDEILMEHTLVFLDDTKIVLNSFIDSISSFHPDLTRDNSIVKYIMNNGKVKTIL